MEDQYYQITRIAVGSDKQTFIVSEYNTHLPITNDSAVDTLCSLNLRPGNCLFCRKPAYLARPYDETGIPNNILNHINLANLGAAQIISNDKLSNHTTMRAQS